MLCELAATWRLYFSSFIFIQIYQQTFAIFCIVLYEFSAEKKSRRRDKKYEGNIIKHIFLRTKSTNFFLETHAYKTVVNKKT